MPDEKRDKQPWERCKGESRKAYDAFCCYRDLEAARTLAATGKALGKSAAFMEEWSARWGWVERVHAWDDHVAAIASDRALDAALAEKQAELDETERWRKARIRAARGLVSSAERALGRFLQDRETLDKLPSTKLLPFLNVIALALRNAQNVERVELGMAPDGAEEGNVEQQAMAVARKALELLEKEHTRSSGAEIGEA